MRKVHLLLSTELSYLALQEVGNYLFIYLFDRDNAFQHRYKLAARVMHTEFTANANSHRQSPCLAFPTLQYNKIYTSYGIHHTIQLNN